MNADYSSVFKVEQLVAQVLVKMEKTGWPVDLDRMTIVLEQLNENLQALEDHLTPTMPMLPKQSGNTVTKPFLKNGGYSSIVTKHMQGASDNVSGPFSKIQWLPINLKSDKQVKKYLLSIGWKPVEWNINKKTRKVTSPKLTEESFYSLKSQIGQQVCLYLKLSHRKSMIEGFKKIVWYDEYSEARISQVISGMTPTFRCTHKGIVNIPGADAIFGLAIRSIFRAPVKQGRKYVMLGVDAKSCQLRMLCHYMNDAIYTKAVVYGKSKEGTDIHSVNMSLTEGLLTTKTQAKRFIYGLLFGASDAKLGVILGGSKSDGFRLRKVFMDRLQSLDKLLKGLIKTSKLRGYLIGLDGRRVFARAPHQMLVYLLQSAEGILMRWALALLSTWKVFEKYDVHLVGFNHDEFQFYVLEEQAKDVSDIVCKAIDKASVYLKLKVPAEGDPSIGNNWMDTH